MSGAGYTETGTSSSNWEERKIILPFDPTRPQNGQTKRQINVGVDKNTLRIQFSRKISQELFGQKQKYLYLQLSNTPENLIKAERIALEIEHDIRAKKLEKDLKLYLPVNQLKQSVGLFYDPNQIHIS